MRVAAIADLHCCRESRSELARIFTEINRCADILVMAGDLTNVGRVEEIESLIGLLKDISLPKVAVLGNHDHQEDHAETLHMMMEAAGVHVLDASAYITGDVAFIGTKGFCGGFGDLRIQPFGEKALKAFVQVGIDEAQRMAETLTYIKTRHKIAVLHYAPIPETLAGEAPELFPFLGASLLAEALDRHGVDVIFHGHAHHGSPRGATPGGIPVHNVCRFVQKRAFGRDCFIYET